LAQILSIPKISPNATKQLYVDIGYLGDILEDLVPILFILRFGPKSFRKKISSKY
jgi:hypothetical protein